jgi:hypothetical protein
MSGRLARSRKLLKRPASPSAIGVQLQMDRRCYFEPGRRRARHPLSSRSVSGLAPGYSSRAVARRIDGIAREHRWVTRTARARMAALSARLARQVKLWRFRPEAGRARSCSSCGIPQSTYTAHFSQYYADYNGLRLPLSTLAHSPHVEDAKETPPVCAGPQETESFRATRITSTYDRHCGI